MSDAPDSRPDIEIPAAPDPFSGRLRAAVIALAANPGDARTRGTLAAMLGYGPGARDAFEGIVAELADRQAIDRRAAVMLRALASRVRKLETVDDRTLLVNVLTADTPIDDEETVIWNDGSDDDEAEEAGSGHGDAPGEGDLVDGRFELKTLIGVGGMAVVFLAHDRKADRDVAVKLLKDAFLDTQAAFDAFTREAKRTAAIDDAGVVQILASGTHEGRPYTVMEYLDGTPLSRMLKAREGRAVTWVRTLDFVTAVGRALAAAHAKGIVHCDLKPSNLFHLADGSWRVLDFGVAQEIRSPASDRETPEREDADKSAEPAIEALTPAYASQEQLRHMSPDPRDDIFSLAVITYEMLTGLHPFDRLPADQARARRLQPPRPEDVPARAWKTLRRGLAFDREDRPKSMTAFLRGLRKPRPVFPIVLLLIVVAIGGGAALRPDLTGAVVQDIRAGGEAGMAYFEDDQRFLQATLDLRAADGPLGPSAIAVARPLIEDRIRRLAQVDSETPTERLRLANWAAKAGQTLFPGDETIHQIAERPFNLLLLDLADRLGRDDPLPPAVLTDEINLLRASDPQSYAGVEDVIVDLILERLRKLQEPAAVKSLTETARELFPNEQWVEPAAPVDDLSSGVPEPSG